MKPYKKTEKMEELEKEYGIPIHELLRILRVDKDMSHQQIADELGVAYVTAIRLLKRVGIYSRKLVFYEKNGKEVNP